MDDRHRRVRTLLQLISLALCAPLAFMAAYWGDHIAVPGGQFYPGYSIILAMAGACLLAAIGVRWLPAEGLQLARVVT